MYIADILRSVLYYLIEKIVFFKRFCFSSCLILFLYDTIAVAIADRAFAIARVVFAVVAFVVVVVAFVIVVVVAARVVVSRIRLNLFLFFHSSKMHTHST